MESHILTLPSEVILSIILHCKSTKKHKQDWPMLCNLARSCKTLNSLMTNHRADIIRHYTHIYHGESGIEAHMFCGMLHSNGDLPALIRTGDDAESRWYRLGKIHRSNDKPAIVERDGTLQWWKDGKRHRSDDQPAYIGHDGVHEWCRRGKLHRGHDKPAYVWTKHGLENWYRRGKLHRAHDKPAVVLSGRREEWYWKGERSRKHDKPTIVVYDNNDQWYWDRGMHNMPVRHLHSFPGFPAFVYTSGLRCWLIYGSSTCTSSYPTIEPCTQVWCTTRLIHRDDDKPAIIRADGTRIWVRNGEIHRDGDLPALIWPDGSLEWFKNNFYHRDGDRPARILPGGIEDSYHHGMHQGQPATRASTAAGIARRTHKARHKARKV